MKRVIALLFICLFTLAMGFTGCSVNREQDRKNPAVTPEGNKTDDDKNAEKDEINEDASEAANAPDENVIKVWCYNYEVSSALAKFKELNPDFSYEFKITDFSTICVDYHQALYQALVDGGPDAPDIYTVESGHAIKYTQGDAYPYAAGYEDLGIDVDALLEETSVPQYFIDIGTNPDGKLVGLGYQSMAGAFFYRRSIAKDVWDTDDPSVIKDIIGPGWDKFFEAAADLRAKGYGICSGPNDIWHSVENSADQGWVIDGKLAIDPKREEFLDLAMKLKENDYHNNTRDWTDEWYNDMKDAGEKKIFGFFGPYWILNHVIIRNCGGEAVGEGTYGDWAVCEPPIGFFWGGTLVLANKESRHLAAMGEILKWITLDTSDTGFQYLLADGKFRFGFKDAVASATVMKKFDGALDFLGGQNAFDVYASAGDLANGKNITQYDALINMYWLDQVYEYTAGNKSREQAIADFKQQVANNLDVIVE